MGNNTRDFRTMNFKELEYKLITNADLPKPQLKGYVAGVKDTIKAIKDAGITDSDLEKWDFSNLKFSEKDYQEFEKMIKELEGLDFTIK